MAYKLKIENKFKDLLELTNNPNYDVTVTGLDPVTSDIITSNVANYGGAKYVSSRKQPRNIVLTIYVYEPVEANRINLYKYIKTKEWIRVYYKNNTRDVYIDGYVESFECDLFTQSQTAQVSIICPKPEFIDMESNTEEISVNQRAFAFPFYSTEDESIILGYQDFMSKLIVNKSDNEVGFIYRIQCYDTVVNPMLYDEDKRVYFKLNGTFVKGTIITISTLDGQKSVKQDIKGLVTNIINKVDTGSTWLKLESGFNHFLQVADSGVENMTGEIIYTNEYEGV